MRQCGFLAALYLTGSVGTAAGMIGMSRASLSRLREREDAGDFARAWDHVLAPPGSGRLAQARVDYRKVTNDQLLWWIETGRVRPVLYRGKLTAIDRKPDDTALFRLLARSDPRLLRCTGMAKIGWV